MRGRPCLPPSPPQRAQRHMGCSPACWPVSGQEPVARAPRSSAPSRRENVRRRWPSFTNYVPHLPRLLALHQASAPPKIAIIPPSEAARSPQPIATQLPIVRTHSRLQDAVWAVRSACPKPCMAGETANGGRHAMGLFERLFGRKQRDERRYDAPRAVEGTPAAPGPLTDEQAIARYRYMLRTAPPEVIEQAHAEAFARLTPPQRAAVLRELAETMPPGERTRLAADQDDPRALARLATRAEIRRPGILERLFGRMGPRYGSGYGP